jgi:hypothetical protein
MPLLLLPQHVINIRILQSEILDSFTSGGVLPHHDVDGFTGGMFVREAGIFSESADFSDLGERRLYSAFDVDGVDL